MQPQLSKCTAVLVVNEVEPCVDFWVNRFGFEKTAEVPHDGRLGFAMVAKAPVEIMFQSLASAQADLPATTLSRTVLFIEVDDIDRTIAVLAGADVVLPKRDTFYGSTEYYVREPGGNVVGFAQFKAQPQSSV